MIYYIINSLYVTAEEIKKQLRLQLTAEGYLFFIALQLIAIVVVFALFYTFRSLGLYKMAKRKGLNRPWLAVLPFSALYVASELAPKSKYIKTYKYLYVFAIVSEVLALGCYLSCDIIYGIQPIINLFNGKIPDPYLLIGYNPIANVIYVFYSIFDIVYIIISLMLYSNVFKAYSVNKSQTYLIWSVLTYWASGMIGLDTLLLAGIFIFTLRKKERVDYDAYISERLKRQQAYRNSQYGPYGNPYNGYGRPPYGENPYGGNPNGGNPYGNQNDPFANQNQQSQAPDPFEEFSNGSNSENNGKNTDDDLFN